MKIIGFALLGMCVGYYAGALVACKWLWPDANLCGLLGVFITGPVGLLVGALIGWKKHRAAKARAGGSVP